MTASAARLLDPPALDGRTVRFLVPQDRAVVLGSTQPGSHIDRLRAETTHTAVLRRRGGGGAVLVGPGLTLWVDVLVPAGDPLWMADVGRSFWWLGDAWVGALAAVGVSPTQVWKQGLQRSRWSERVCFAGLGPGEVTVGDGQKVVGMSQRRTRTGAHFQCAVPIVWDPSDLLAVMDLENDARQQATIELAKGAHAIGPATAAQLREAFPAVLP